MVTTTTTPTVTPVVTPSLSVSSGDESSTEKNGKNVSATGGENETSAEINISSESLLSY